MNATAVLADLQANQMAFTIITMLELTGHLFPPPALLKNSDHFDYAIIGGGTAGSVIATRLVQQKYNVLLIEAGEDAPFESTLPALFPYLRNSRVDWNYTTEPNFYTFQSQVDKISKLGLGKMLGGSSQANNMIYSNGNFENFNEWARITKDPIWKWKNVLPYFMKSENFTEIDLKSTKFWKSYGSKGYIGVTRDEHPFTDEVLEGFRQDGRDIIVDTVGDNLGYGRAILTIKDGIRQGAGTQYLKHISESRYIATAKSTLATKIIFDENKKAVGVEVITDEGKKITIHVRQEVIVTAGAIKTPQLLMLSGIGPKKELEEFNITCISDLPVGKNLQDHVGALVIHKTNKPIVKKEVNPGVYPTGIFVGYARLNTSIYHKKFPDYGAIGHIIDDTKFLLQFCTAVLNFPGRTCNKIAEQIGNNISIFSLVYNLYSESRGEVVLRSIDPEDSPIVIPDSFGSNRDLDDFINYVKDYLRVQETEAFKALGIVRVYFTRPKCDAFIIGTANRRRCNALNTLVSLKSFSGTCAMSSVVDSRLRVMGVKGLRVADASIMPTIVTGVTYATVVMIGEKAADMIIEDAGPEFNSMKHKKVRKDQIKNMPN